MGLAARQLLRLVCLPVPPPARGKGIKEGSDGRGSRTRTCGLHVPNVARYQTALCPDNPGPNRQGRLPMSSKIAVPRRRWPAEEAVRDMGKVRMRALLGALQIGIMVGATRLERAT